MSNLQILWKVICGICNGFLRPVTCATSCRSCLTFAMFSSLLAVHRLPERSRLKFTILFFTILFDIFPNCCFIWNISFREVFWKFLWNDLITFGSHPRSYKKNTINITIQYFLFFFIYVRICDTRYCRIFFFINFNIFKQLVIINWIKN